MRADGVYSAVVHDDDLVGVLHRAYPLCDDEHGSEPNSSLSPFLIAASVAVSTADVESSRIITSDFKSARAMHNLCFCPPDIDAALSELGFVAVGERGDEIVRLRRARGMFDLRVRGVGIAPLEIFLYRAGEKHVFCSTIATASRRVSSL